MWHRSDLYFTMQNTLMLLDKINDAVIAFDCKDIFFRQHLKLKEKKKVCLCDSWLFKVAMYCFGLSPFPPLLEFHRNMCQEILAISLNPCWLSDCLQVSVYSEQYWVIVWPWWKWPIWWFTFLFFNHLQPLLSVCEIWGSFTVLEQYLGKKTVYTASQWKPKTFCFPDMLWIVIFHSLSAVEKN